MSSAMSRFRNRKSGTENQLPQSKEILGNTEVFVEQVQPNNQVNYNGESNSVPTYREERPHGSRIDNRQPVYPDNREEYYQDNFQPNDRRPQYQEPVHGSRRVDVQDNGQLDSFVRPQYQGQENMRDQGRDNRQGTNQDPRFNERQDNEYNDSPYNVDVTPVHNNQGYPNNVQPNVGVVVENGYYNQANKNVNREIAVDTVAVATNFSYTNPDTFGLQVLGFNSVENVRIVQPTALSIEPLEITNIIDSTGKVSERLHNYMDRYGITVLPLRECSIFESISSIEGFKIVEYGGNKYASYCGGDYPKMFVDNLISNISEYIRTCRPFGFEEDPNDLSRYRWDPNVSRLCKKVDIGGKTVEVPSLCISELEYIAARLRNYHCHILDIKNDFPHITVGINLKGVNINEGVRRI